MSKQINAYTYTLVLGLVEALELQIKKFTKCTVMDMKIEKEKDVVEREVV